MAGGEGEVRDMPDDTIDTKEQKIRPDVVKQRHKEYLRGYTSVADLSDEEYARATGYNIAAGQSREQSTQNALAKIRNWFETHFPKPHTPQKQPM